MKLVSPDDPILTKPLPTFDDSQLKDYGYEDRQKLSDDMFEFISKNGGIGLTANQVGMQLNCIVIGGHPSIENGMKLTCFNPVIISMSEEQVTLKEGCLSFPFLFFNLKRPRKIVVKYRDIEDKIQEGHLDGYMSRIFQHEYDHVEGKTMLDKVSKFRYNLAMKKAQKLMKKHMRELKNAKKGD